MSGKRRSATKRPAPVSNARSSIRRTGLPMYVVCFTRVHPSKRTLIGRKSPLLLEDQRWQRKVMGMSVVLEKRSNGVAVVTIDRPQVLNALDVPAKERLGAIWQEISDDAGIRAAVLTGAGEKAFCAGSDIKEINPSGRMAATEALLRRATGRDLALSPPH